MYTPSVPEKFRGSFRKPLRAFACEDACASSRTSALYNFLIETRSFSSPAMRWHHAPETHGASPCEEHLTSRVKSADPFPDQRS
jgi:hypothetical protein